MRGRTIALLTSALALHAAVAAGATPGLDIRGDWSGQATGGSPYTEHFTAENCSTGAISGNGDGGGYTWPLSGTLDDHKLNYQDGPYDQLSYSSQVTGTFSSDGNSFTGTYHDTNGNSGSVTLTRKSGPPADGAGCPPGSPNPNPNPNPSPNPSPSPNPGPANNRPTRTQVICNYDVLTSVDTCGATVGDAGPPPAVAPGGAVKFTSASGGLFSLGDTCRLAVSQSSPSVAFCSVQFIPAPAPDYPGFPSITGTYSGDGQHAASSGTTARFGFSPSANSSGDQAVQFGAPIGPSGAYPNQLQITDQVPAQGTKVGACATGATGATGAAAATTPEQDLAALDAALKQATAQLQAKHDALQTLAGQYNSLVAQAAVDEAQATNPTPAQLQQLQQLITDVSKLQAAEQATCSAVLQNASPRARAGGASAATRQRTRRNRRTVLGRAGAIAAAPGQLKLVLRLNRRALTRLAGRRRSVLVVVQVNTILPSARFPHGLPLTTVKVLRLRPLRKHR